MPCRQTTGSGPSPARPMEISTSPGTRPLFQGITLMGADYTGAGTKQDGTLPSMDKGQMEFYENVLEVVGNTPLVRMGRVEGGEGIKATLLAQVEYLNPGGSVKDRLEL